ncbi:MAG: AMP-binding protein [Microthrixaceae bacterium]|nr:AMP-binding protein [Microthrixaceae bacterium]
MLSNVVSRANAAFRQPFTLADFSDRVAAMWGPRQMVDEAGGYRATFTEAGAMVRVLSEVIAASCAPNERVVLAVPNSYDQFLLCLAVSRAGCLPVPVNSQMKPAEIDHVVADSEAALVVTSLDQLDEMALDLRDRFGSIAAIEPATPAHDDVAALFYTSGTTGKPKGAALTHKALVGSAGLATLAPIGFGDVEVVVALPVAHIFGFAMLVASAAAGVRVHFMSRFRAGPVLDAIEERRSAAFVGVPAMYRMMLEAGADHRDLKSIRLWISGADALPEGLASTFKKLGAAAELPMVGPVGEAAFVEGYGMVEIGGGAALRVSLPLVPERFGGNLALRMPGYRFRVVDEDGKVLGHGREGELQMRGPGVLKQYWNAPDATRGAITDDGWLRTGDLVRLSWLGTITFCGRSKHIIKSGGYSVYPLEVEAVIDAHPDVVESAVVSKADPKLGSVPVAAVRVRKGAKVTEDELRSWVGERVSHYKEPREVKFVDELPRTGTEKVQREHLEELFR